MSQISRILWGIILIVVGIVLGLNTLGFTEINLFFKGWWTLFIIVPSFIHLFDDKEEKTSNVIGLGIGIALLLACQNIIPIEIILKLIVPFILVVLGISFLFCDTLKGKITEKVKKITSENMESITATFAEQKINKEGEKFKSVNLDAVFGGISFDLRKAELEKETVIKASCIFGGIDILLPDDVQVKVKSTPIFGGVSNKLRPKKETKKTIYIDAFCLFGGIDIK